MNGDRATRLVIAPPAMPTAIALANMPYTSSARPNGWRVSDERRAEGDERVRCPRMSGGPTISLRRERIATLRRLHGLQPVIKGQVACACSPARECRLF